MEITDLELDMLMTLVAQKSHQNGEPLGAATPLNTLFGKLSDEQTRRQEAAANAAAVAEREAKRQAEMSALLDAYPVKPGDVIKVQIGKRAYRARVLQISQAPAKYGLKENIRYVGLHVLRKDGELNIQMNGGKYGNGWWGHVAPADVLEVIERNPHA
jgi:hypothetical protein